MHAGSSTEWPREIDRLRRRFEAWRRQRDRGRRIPQALWVAAVSLARRYGVSTISRAVRVDYYSLKKRLEAALKPSGSRAAAAATVATTAVTGGFVEIPVPVVAGASPCVLELEDRHGGRLRLELRGLDAEALTALVRSVWSARR